MTNFARFSQSPNICSKIPGYNNFVLSSDGCTLAVTGATGGFASVSGSGKYVFGVGVSDTEGDIQLGIWTASYFNSATPFSTIFLNQALQVFYYNNGASLGYQFNVAGSWAGQVWIALDNTAGLVWLSLDLITYYGASGETYSASDVAAGTGGIPWGTFANVSGGSMAWAQYGDSGASGNLLLLNGESGFPQTLPSGYGPLPGTVNLVSVNPLIEGQPIAVNWTGGDLDGLDAVFDGSTITLTGTTTGAGGLAYGPTISDNYLHTVSLFDPHYPADGTLPTRVMVQPPGTVIYQGNVTMSDGAGGLIPLSEVVGTVSFALYFSVASFDSLFGVPCGIRLINSAEQILAQIDVNFKPDGTFTGDFNSGNGGATEADGTGVILTLSGEIGPLSIDGGLLVGALSYEWSTGATFSSDPYTFSTFADPADIAYIQFFVGGTRGEALMAATITAPPTYDPPEDLLATQSIGSSVKLSWAAYTGTGVTAIKIYRGTGLSAAFGACTEIGSVAVGATVYRDDTAAYNASYTYFVTAYGGGGESGPSNAATITTTSANVIPGWNGVKR